MATLIAKSSEYRLPDIARSGPGAVSTQPPHRARVLLLLHREDAVADLDDVSDVSYWPFIGESSPPQVGHVLSASSSSKVFETTGSFGCSVPPNFSRGFLASSCRARRAPRFAQRPVATGA